MSSILSIPLFSQSKFEREYRVKTNEIPSSARDFIDSCNFSKKIKWYGEESQNGKSFEAKVKENGRRYSIEFDTLGNLQDVEIKIEVDEVSSATHKAIQDHFNQVFVRHKIIKIQSQWTGDRAVLRELVRTNKTNAAYTLKYEIVVKGKKAGEVKWYEILFDETGNEEKILPIQFNNPDNLYY